MICLHVSTVEEQPVMDGVRLMGALMLGCDCISAVSPCRAGADLPLIKRCRNANSDRTMTTATVCKMLDACAIT